MNTNKSLFNWLHAEMAQIRTRGFHKALPDRSIDIEGVCSPNYLASDYATFLQEFGWVQLYCHPADGPMVSVYPVRSLRIQEVAGRRMVEFGYIRDSSALFDVGILQDAGPSPVFKSSKGKVVQTHDSFDDWLRESCERARSTFSKRRWEAILKGPAVFSESQMEVVIARRKFSWKHVGFDENGDAIFEVSNQSSRRLPYLSIGIQGKDGSKLLGGAWLDVHHIGPGESGLVVKDCYKTMLTQEEIEFFDEIGPLPETMERYWEFRG